MINETSIIQRNDGIVETEIDGELVMMSIENGAYYGLDSIAKRIWQLIETPSSVESICNKVLQEYEVEKSQCLHELLEFLNAMAKQNVIKLN
tara:strand:- start:615 stop:890 length:276 start_codon:yes stop_codon:yes gene_type:complete